jgi:hypothetical protein
LGSTPNWHGNAAGKDSYPPDFRDPFTWVKRSHACDAKETEKQHNRFRGMSVAFMPMEKALKDLPSKRVVGLPP